MLLAYRKRKARKIDSSQRQEKESLSHENCKKQQAATNVCSSDFRGLVAKRSFSKQSEQEVVAATLGCLGPDQFLSSACN